MSDVGVCQAGEGLLFEHTSGLKQLIVVDVDPELRIVFCNDGLLRLLDLDEIPAGQSLCDVLQTEVTQAEVQAAADDAQWLVLRFAPPRPPRSAINARIYAMDNGWRIVGERQIASQEEVLAEFARVNEQLVNTTRMLTKKQKALERSILHIKRLEGLLPICSHCHRIRNETADWESLEGYLDQRTDATLTHSICPECLTEHYVGVASGPKKNNHCLTTARDPWHGYNGDPEELLKKLTK